MRFKIDEAKLKIAYEFRQKTKQREGLEIMVNTMDLKISGNIKKYS